jgi:hypothetical protein
MARLKMSLKQGKPGSALSTSRRGFQLYDRPTVKQALGLSRACRSALRKSQASFSQESASSGVNMVGIEDDPSMPEQEVGRRCRRQAPRMVQCSGYINPRSYAQP